MTRDEILAAAALIFSEKGFHAASMQDIAQAVNLQKASLYHHVSSKQEMLLAVLDQALDLLIENMQQVLALPLAPDQKLRQAIQVYLKTILEQRELSAVLLLEHRSLDSELHAQHILRRDRFETLWRDLLREGMDAGQLCCTDPSMTSKVLLGAINWTITWYRADGNFSPTEIADQLADVFLLGLARRG